MHARHVFRRWRLRIGRGTLPAGHRSALPRGKTRISRTEMVPQSVGEMRAGVSNVPSTAFRKFRNYPRQRLLRRCAPRNDIDEPLHVIASEAKQSDGRTISEMGYWCSRASGGFLGCRLGVDAYDGAMLEKGFVQIYTGDGKGKTTAAFGLALRANGQGNKVLIYQFLKPPALELGERFALQRASIRIRVEALEEPWDLAQSLDNEQDVARTKKAIKDVLARLIETAEKGFYDVLILDEIVFCLSEGLADFEDIRRLIEGKNPHVELILTGRGATPELIALADLVTEMKKIKHPFDAGMPARQGIDY